MKKRIPMKKRILAMNKKIISWLIPKFLKGYHLAKTRKKKQKEEKHE